MRRSIIAIFAIALLQVGYMAYFQYEVSRDRLYASIGRVAEPLAFRSTNADISAIDEPTAFGVFGEEMSEPTDDRSSDGFVRYLNANPSHGGDGNRSARRGKRGFATHDVDFGDTVISIARTEPIAFREYPESVPDNIEYTVEVHPVADEPKPKKKNIFRKALPIVKKPYDWMKALGRTFQKDSTDQ